MGLLPTYLTFDRKMATCEICDKENKQCECDGYQSLPNREGGPCTFLRFGWHCTWTRQGYDSIVAHKESKLLKGLEDILDNIDLEEELEFEFEFDKDNRVEITDIWDVQKGMDVTINQRLDYTIKRFVTPGNMLQMAGDGNIYKVDHTFPSYDALIITGHTFDFRDVKVYKKP